MFVLIFYTTLVTNISYSKKSLARYDQKYILISMKSIHYSCKVLMKLSFSQNILDKMSKCEILWKSFP
jgi:hypothetical protein